MYAFDLTGSAGRLATVAVSRAPAAMNLADHQKVISCLQSIHESLSSALALENMCIRRTRRNNVAGSIIADGELAKLEAAVLLGTVRASDAANILNDVHLAVGKVCDERRRGGESLGGRRAGEDLRAATSTALYRAAYETASLTKSASQSLGNFAAETPEDHVVACRDLTGAMRHLDQALQEEGAHLADEASRYAKQTGGKRLARTVSRQADAVAAAAQKLKKAHPRMRGDAEALAAILGPAAKLPS